MKSRKTRLVARAEVKDQPMVRKRKYSRDHWKKNVQDASQISRKLSAQSQTSKIDTEQRIGSSADDGTLQMSYDHRHLRPYYKKKLVVPRRFVVNSGANSLRLLAAKKLALNCQQLTSMHLGVGNWNLWIDVWELIIANEFDSIGIFEMFAKSFHDQDGFKAHFYFANTKTSQCTNDSRNKQVIEKALGNTKHRLETISLNARGFPNIFSHITFDHLVILDLSACGQQSKNFYLALTRVRSLMSLDCSNTSNVDDSICKSWVMSMKLGRWPHLKMISLKNTSLTTDAFVGLMGLPAISLSYIESSFKLNVTDVDWQTITISEFKKDSLALKFYHLERKAEIPRYDHQSIVLDYKVIGEPFNPAIICIDSDRRNYEMVKLWNERSKPHSRWGEQYHYIRKTHLITSTVPLTVKKSQRKNPKMTNQNLKSFFDL